MARKTKKKKPAPSPPPAAASSIPEIMTLLSDLSEKFEPQDSEMKEWIIQHFHNPAIIEQLQDSTLLALRVLDAIGRLEPVNGITISKQARILKGSVSKITRRLLAQKLIKKELLPNNKKEVLFRLTPLGKEMFQAHQAFDRQMEQGFVRFLQKYNAEELRFLTRLLQELKETSLLK